jgi:hypothetical protein
MNEIELHDDTGETIDCEFENDSGSANDKDNEPRSATTAGAKEESSNNNNRNRNKNTFASLSMNGEHHNNATDQLEKCGKWLASVPRDDITKLRQTVEFQEFLRAFERLGHAHLRVVVNNNQATVAMETKQEEASKIQQSPAFHHNCTNESGKQKKAKMILPNETNDKRSDETTTSNNKASSQCDVRKKGNRENNPSHDDFAAHTRYLQNDVLSEGDPPQTTTTEQRRELDADYPSRRKSTTNGSTAAVAAASATTTNGNGNGNNFLRFTDDILLRILEFLRCKCLIQTSLTCSRFHQLATKSATQRTYDIATRRQLRNVMQLLRAREQIHYVDSEQERELENQTPASSEEDVTNDNGDENEAMVDAGDEQDALTRSSSIDFSVPVPTLLPSRRILVTNAGDPEYNGVYYCTDCNGNGFVFTKPRFSSFSQQIISQQQHQQHHLEDNMVSDEEINPLQQNHNQIGAIQRAGRLPLANHANDLRDDDDDDENEDRFQPRRPPQQRHHHQRAITAAPNNPRRSERFAEDSLQTGLPLRCVIAKAYSNHVSTVLL